MGVFTIFNVISMNLYSKAINQKVEAIHEFAHKPK